MPWREDELVVIAPATHALARRRKITVADLRNEPFVLREPGSGTRVVAEAALAEHGIHPGSGLQLGSTEAIKQAVAAGLGLALVSRAAAADQIALGYIAVLSITGMTVRRPLNELRLAGRSASATTLAFRELMGGRRTWARVK